ncbi:hypothetical protein [Bacillus velezensis]|uniref:hypothetical protein n=1 Tax=Bacillus velezensis TaxID=492670 RepID=UPI001E4D9D0E|nr:hypothetical protein [Bacillus velezensis]
MVGVYVDDRKSVAYRDADGVFREDFGEAIVIKYLTAEELNALKSTAEAFCEAAIRDYNESVEALK